MDHGMSENEKATFDAHMNSIRYIVFDSLMICSDDDKRVLQSKDIIEEGQHLAEETDRKMGDEGLSAFILTGILKIMLQYFLKYHKRYPVGIEYDRFLTHKNYVEHIDRVRQRLTVYDPRKPRRIGRRRYQVHPVLQTRKCDGFYNKIFPTLAEYSEKFTIYTRMSRKQFCYLLDMIRQKIKKNPTRRDTIPPALRLLLTLRFLATGDNVVTLAAVYCIGLSTAKEIIKETCDAIYDCMHHLYVKFPDDMEMEAEKWNALHHLPHCIGAADGKHIRIKKPPHSGSRFYNYKKFFSIVLMATCDAEANFTYVAIGARGSLSDQRIWRNCELGRALDADAINFSPQTYLPNSNTPFGYFILGDEAFPLSKYMLRNYSGQNLPADELYFNTRIATGRNTIERSFGILANRFKIFRTEMPVTPETAKSIVKATVVLHNYIRKTEDANTPAIDKFVRTTTNALYDQRGIGGNTLSEARAARDVYKSYLWND